MKGVQSKAKLVASLNYMSMVSNLFKLDVYGSNVPLDEQPTFSNKFIKILITF